MKNKLTAAKPFILMLYGYPGSGKTTFSRQFSEIFDNVVHLETDRVGYELGNDLQKINQHDPDVVNVALNYMAKEFLNSGMSVIFDVSVNKKLDRKRIMKLAQKSGAKPILIWLQIDANSAFTRSRKRDRRKIEDKFARNFSSEEFQSIITSSQNPNDEDYVVISGKHTFNTQQSFVIKKMYELGVLSHEQLSQKVVKPELVNLIPNLSSRNILGRRNISIR